MSRGVQLVTRATLALAGATAVVGAELAALAVAVYLEMAAVGGVLPASASSLPVFAVTVATAGVAIVVGRHASDGATLTSSGAALIVAAPFTAFGGGCGIQGDGLTLFRSGVRIGIAVDQCVTFLNGALLVLGYALLAAGLWLAAERLPILGRTRLQSARPSE